MADQADLGWVRKNRFTHKPDLGVQQCLALRIGPSARSLGAHLQIGNVLQMALLVEVGVYELQRAVQSSASHQGAVKSRFASAIEAGENMKNRLVQAAARGTACLRFSSTMLRIWPCKTPWLLDASTRIFRACSVSGAFSRGFLPAASYPSIATRASCAVKPLCSTIRPSVAQYST
jgi:hypothetical protein